MVHANTANVLVVNWKDVLKRSEQEKMSLDIDHAPL